MMYRDLTQGILDIAAGRPVSAEVERVLVALRHAERWQGFLQLTLSGHGFRERLQRNDALMCGVDFLETQRAMKIRGLTAAR